MKKFALYLVLAFAGAVGIPVAVAADYEEMSAIAPMDHKVSITRDAFYSGSETHDETPMGDATLAFRVRLPKGWDKLPDDKTSQADVGKDLFRQVAKYVSPPNLDRRSVFWVRTLDLKGLVSAKNWFVHYTLVNGFTAQSLNVISERKIEAEYVLIENGMPYVVRAVVEISGSRVVMAEYKVPEPDEESQKDQQVWAMVTFKLLAPDTSPIVPLDQFAFVDIAKFSYPKNWILYAPGITTIDRMEASVIRLKGDGLTASKSYEVENAQLSGRIDVTVVSRTTTTTLANEVDIVKSGLAKKKLEIGKLIENIKGFEMAPEIEFSQIDAYEIGSKDKRLIGYEYWVALLQTQGRFYVIRLLTVGRGDDFLAWSENVESYRMLIKTLSPVHDASED